MTELSASLFSEVAPSAAIYSQAITHVVNFFLDDTRKEAKEEIVRLALSPEPTAEAKLLPFIHEALSPYLFLFYIVSIV